jgi:hypothetical protein
MRASERTASGLPSLTRMTICRGIRGKVQELPISRGRVGRMQKRRSQEV